MHHVLDTILDLLERVIRHHASLREACASLILDRFLFFLNQIFFRHLLVNVFQEAPFEPAGHGIHDLLHLRLRLLEVALHLSG